MPSLLILIAWLVNLSQAQAKCDVVSFVNTRGVAATPTLPINGGKFTIASLHRSDIADNTTGGTELPASSFSLRFIGIGRGTQNYTCATPTSAPVSIGAVATLFDVTELAITDTGLFDLLPNVIVYMPLHQSIFVLGWELSLSVLGHHFFTANITPTFEFTDSNDVFYGKKTADIKADALASKGPAGTGAVDVCLSALLRTLSTVS